MYNYLLSEKLSVRLDFLNIKLNTLLIRLTCVWFINNPVIYVEKYTILV